MPDKRTMWRIIDSLQGYGYIHHITKPTQMVYGDGPRYWIMQRLAEIRKKEGKNVKIEWRELV